MHVKVRDRFRPFFPLALLRVRRERARARAEISSERAPFSFFSKDSEKKRERSFCAFPIRVYYKANSSRSKGRFSRTRTRPRQLLSSYKRIARIRSALKKEKLSEKKRNSRLLESALKERKAFISVLRFFPRHQRKERGVESEAKKKREISRKKKKPKGGKELAF